MNNIDFDLKDLDSFMVDQWRFVRTIWNISNTLSASFYYTNEFLFRRYIRYA
jgi:hypothetical protein